MELAGVVYEKTMALWFRYKSLIWKGERVMHLRCKHCGCEFSREDGQHEAELALKRGEMLGDFICPFCGAGDAMIEEVWGE